MEAYDKFLECKRIKDESTGLDNVPELNKNLFDFQRDIVKWALRRGRSAIFADCGMGKTIMQLEWADKIGGRVIIATPLAVASQTVSEAMRFGIKGVEYLREDNGTTRIVVTNYEMLEKFDPSNFNAIVLDESSILKSYTGKFRNYIVDEWGTVPHRLCATATPAPNDFMELGNHSEFLGALSRVEMLATFFVHDGGETQKWRLKGHAESEFWKWLCGWAVMIRKPSDLGYDDGDFTLPPCNIKQIAVDYAADNQGLLFAVQAHTMQERREARKSSVNERVQAVADLVNGTNYPWIVWCDLNDESASLKSAIEGAEEVRGSDSNETKTKRMADFSNGNLRVLITKPSIAGFGMNWQHCSHMAFTGLSDSYEQFYQALRRCWRFGQKEPVSCYVVTAVTEGAVVSNIKRKEKQSTTMANMMVSHMAELNRENIKNQSRSQIKIYEPSNVIQIPTFL